jgi:hypothetical protein
VISDVNKKYFLQCIDSSSIKKNTPNEISANCPLCGDKKHRLHLVHYKKGGYDYVHCFNSGCLVEEATTVRNFINYAKPDLLSLYNRETLKDKIKEIQNTNTDDDIFQNIQKNILKKTINEEKVIPEFILKNFIKCKNNEDCLKYLKSRHCDKFNDKYSIDNFWFSVNKFFIYNNKKVFLKDYLIVPIEGPEGWYGFYSRSIKEKKFSTFLLENKPKFWVSKPELFNNLQNIEIITEGVFDSISSGFENTAAMLSADIPEDILQNLNKNCIIAFDNDKTGIKKAIEYSKLGFNIFVPNDDQAKDFNDMLSSKTLKEIKEYILQNTYKGVIAETRLRMKNV